MKRIFCAALTIAMALPVFSALPVSAKPYAEYPWVYEDFEKDEPINATASNASIARAAGGVGGTQGAARITATRDFGTAKFPFRIKKGTTYRLSAWVKMVGDIPSNSSFHFIIYTHQKLADGSPAENASCFNDISVSNIPYSQDEYVYITTTFTYEGTGRLNSQTVETCDGDATVEMRVGNGQLASTNGNPIDFLLDDLIVEPVTEEGGDAVVDTSIGFKNGNFETGYDDTAWSKSNCTTELVEGANGTKNGVMITSTGNYGCIKQRAPMEFNKAYRISLYAKAGDAATVGKEFKLIVDRKDGKTDDSITTNYEFLPQTAITSSPEKLVLTDEWQKIEMIYKNSLATFEQTKPYVYPRVGSGTGLECYCIDELEIEELPQMVYNGSFENGLDGWNEDGAAAEVVSDAPEGASQSVKITETADYGGLKQGIAAKQGGKYKITFSAKGESWDSGSDEIEIYPLMDRFASNSTDSYEAMYETLTLPDGTPAMLTKEWQTYEFEYDCNIETDSYRVPLFYFQIGDGEQHAVYHIANIEITDMTEPDEPDIPDEPETAPEVRGLNISGQPIEGFPVELTYEISGDIPGGLVKIMRSFEGRYISLGSAFLDGTPVSYTPTAADAGGTVKFIAMPINGDEEPLTVKSAETAAVAKALDIAPEFVSGFGSGTVKASVRVTNNEGDRAMTAVLALFDETNTMVRMTEQPIHSVYGAEDTVTLELPEDGAQTARVFVWEGASAAGTTMASLIGNISITK